MTADLPTEQRNPRTRDVDLVPTADAVEMILREDALAVDVALAAAADIARIADIAKSRIDAGGRLHYFGAGASGRLAVLDATELTPTYGLPRDTAVAHFPGGPAALVDSTIDLEDGDQLGESDAAEVTSRDIVVGVTASGTTRYVEGALRRARAAGAHTALITCNPGSRLASLADDLVVLDTGPEAVTGSTRLKAGTATKVVLNAFSTALMVRAGRTYSNLMIGMSVTNDKLRERAVALVSEAAGTSAEDARAALEQTGGSIPRALTALLAGVDDATATAALRDAGTVRQALALLSEGRQ